jgi:UDP-N-acetylglucosamine--N-acetylmuramyl-(pentapeptide) pyrophosphoryl-undecaprenol N-acetylglucosamine transferase
MSRLMIMAGGTGGHVYPALAVAHTLRDDGVEVFWLGTRKGIEARLVPASGFDIEWVSISGIKGKGVLAMLLAPLRILLAMWQTVVVIFRRRPDAVLGMGGFVAGPGGLASRLLLLPLIIHESNAVAGFTNRWLARIASRVLVGFPAVLADNRHCVYVGNPVRPEIAALPEPVDRLAGHGGKLRLAVVGGSLGAQVLNQVVPAAVANLQVQLRPLIRHQAGRGKLEEARQKYAEHGVAADCIEYVEDMAALYAWADLVICRAGAMTVAEIAAAGLAAIFVPLPHAIYDHQTANARFLVDNQAALLLPQDQLGAESLAALLSELNDDRSRLLDMSSKARQLAISDASRRVADICREVMYA